ncbi:MAG: hypothetical protein E7583_06415 [Ruminococcaceae bacterium]|nr:hypothetical protein [Oscillospiraceae bacterium]
MPLTEKADILFLGCSYYAFDVDASVKEFLKNNKDNIGKIVCLGTSAMMRSMKKPVNMVAKDPGLIVADEEFHTRGEFGPLHKGRPNGKDIAESALRKTQALKSLKDFQETTFPKYMIKIIIHL